MVQVVDRPLPASQPEPPSPPEARSFPWRDLLPFLILAAIGLGLRLYNVGDRALHHDESLHSCTHGTCTSGVATSTIH